MGNIVNRTQSLTSKDISSLMSYDGENTEANHHPVQRQSPQVKPKRILPSTNTRRMLPKPDWNFNSHSFRTSNSRIEDNQTRIKKPQSFAGEPTDLDGKSIQNIGDALLSSDELESIHSTNVDNVSSNDQYQEKDDSTLKPRDFKKGNIKISRSPGFKSHSFSIARPETKQESRPIDNTALSKMGVHLISSDSDTARSSQTQKEFNQQSLDTNQRAVSPAHSFVRNRTRSFDELLSGTPQVKHLEYTESTRENSAKTTSKYNSMNINYVAVKENDVEIMQNDSSPVNSISFRSSSSPSYDEKKIGRNESIKLNENFASLSLKQEESRNSKHQRSVLLSPQEQNSEDAKTRRSFQLSPQEQDVGDTKKEVSSTNTHGVINDHIDAVNQRLKQNSRWTDNPKTTSKTGHTHYKQSKKRAVNRKKNQHKRVTMEYGEYGHVMMKDNDSEGRASIDDGYETSRTYGSDLTNSTASELYQSTSNGLNLEHGTPSTNQKPSSSISTNHKVQSLSNLHEILNLECEDERKKQHEEEQRIHVATEAQEDLEQGRKGIHQKLDNMLKARVKTMNASDRSFTKRQTKFPDPLLLANEPPLIIDKEPSLRLEESIESLSKQQQNSDPPSIPYTSNQQSIGHQQAGSQPYSQHTPAVELPYTQQTVTEFSQNVNRPERSHSLNQKPPVMEYLSNQQPIDMNFQTNQQPSFNGNHQRNVPGNHQSMLSGNLHQNQNSSFNYTQPPTHEGYQQMSTAFSGNHQSLNSGNHQSMVPGNHRSMVPGNHQSMVPGNHQSMLPGNHHDNPHMNFNQNQQPTNEIPDDLYAKPDKANRHSEYTTSNQQQPRKIDASYNTPSSSNYVSLTSSFHSTAPLMEKKLFHLRDKDTSELNKKESMLSELKLAMFKRSRPASPEIEDTDHHPYPVIKEDYGNTPQHDYRQENNYGNSSVNHELYQQNSQSSYGTNMSNAGQIDLYNSFPLPTHKQNEELANGFQAYTNQSESEEKLTDENPIDKNQVMMMLKSHIKDKTGLSSLTRNNKDINFSRPKISSQTFSLISKDIDSEMVQNESRKLEPDFSDQTPEILVTEFRSPEVQRSRGLTINHSDEFETVNVRNRASTFTEAQPETDTNTQAIPPMDEVDSSPKNNSHLSRTDSFQSPYSIKYTQDGSSLPEEKPNFVSHASDTSVSRHESFSSISVEPPQSRSISRVESMRSLKEEASLSRNTSFSTADVIQSRSRSSSFKSQIDETPIRRDRSYTNGSIADLPESIADVSRSRTEGSILDRNDSFSSMRVEYPESRSVSRIHSFSSTEYQPRTRSNTVLDSAIRYEKTKQIVEEPLDLSLDLDSVDRDTADRGTAAVISNRTHEPLIAPDSRGLNLRQTEYYLPEENEEKVIKPSEYKTHRFNDRNRSPKIEVGTESQPTTGRIQLVTDGTAESKRISNERISSNRSVPSVVENERKLSLTELKKKRQQERLMNSKRLSSSEPLLDKVGSLEFADNIQTLTQHTPRLSNNVRVNDTVSRKKKVEKYSSEIYTNTNVGRINIPDSFQQNKDSEWMIDEHEKRSDERFNERKHKREKAASNSSTPRASTPKKSKRRFSLTNIVSGGSTPRSARTDVTEFSNMSTSPRSMPATRPNSRPSSPSLGKRIKNIFSPRSKRKNKKNDSLDDSQDEIVDDDIIRRLNMNVSSNNNGTVTASSLGSLVTSGYSSIRSESGLSMTVANDEDFGIDDSFLSHQEWLNSHGGKVTVTKRPSIKQAIVPFNSSRNVQNNGSWKVRKNIGKVTVPEVFSSSRKIPDRQNGDAEFPYNSKFRNLRSSPAMTRKSKSKKSGLQAHDDVVFTSFDVAE
ncbi:uro-adherence factor A-like [Clytia hemisphaerica]